MEKQYVSNLRHIFRENKVWAKYFYEFLQTLKAILLLGLAIIFFNFRKRLTGCASRKKDVWFFFAVMLFILFLVSFFFFGGLTIATFDR